MSAYFLVIDTETSGLPKNWKSPYAVLQNWPFALQVAWVVYNANGQLIKQENHYIKNIEGRIEPSAERIHGINAEFLAQNGLERCEILQKLSFDITHYQPILLGHFAEFDLHIIGADSFRCGMDNPVMNRPYFCTMKNSEHLIRNPGKQLRLVDLYSFLFHKALQNPHHALNDALATGECFFELLKRGDIRKIDLEKKLQHFKGPETNNKGCFLGALFLALIPLIILIIVYGQKSH